MIDVRIKSTGVILDIAPDAEFQIEIDNPMFADDRCPVPFSTEIGFLPTQKNKQQLGYIAAMHLSPSVREFDVEIYVSGYKLLDGMMRFSSVKDGLLNYTFTGRAIEDDWSEKIYEKSIYRMEGNEEYQTRQYGWIQAGDMDALAAPLLINATETDSVAIQASEEYKTVLVNNGIHPVDIELKYHNYPLKSLSIFTPAITVFRILANEMGNVDVPDSDLEEELRTVAILGQYKTDFVQTASGIPDTGLDVARALPDITAMELLRILLKMFCLALFSDGERFAMMNMGAILEDRSHISDWDGKVARDAEISVRPAGGYAFGYANDTDESFNPNENYTSVEYYTVMLSQLDPTSETYAVFKHLASTVFLSARATPAIGGSSPLPKMLLCDMLSRSIESYDYSPDDSDGDTFDSTVNAKLVRCIPDTLFSTDREEWQKANWRMAAIINPETIGDARGSDVIIGRIEGGAYEKQLTDGSVRFENDHETHPYLPLEKHSLRPDDLFRDYHSSFAQWCRSSHQVVSAGLNLTVPEIAAFRIWNKVSFSGRTWLVGKLTLTFYSANGRVDAEGEFISVN